MSSLSMKTELPHRKMDRISMWVVLIMISHCSHGEFIRHEKVTQALVQFMAKLSPGDVQRGGSWGWNMTSDPCRDLWNGVDCDSLLNNVKKIILENQNFVGVLDAGFLCVTDSLEILSLQNNQITGLIPEEIGHCQQLSHLYLRGNKFSGDLPDSLSKLGNLKTLDIAYNDFYGEIPDLPKILGLKTLLAENNKLCGTIPNFDFSNIEKFDASNNNLSGLVPDLKGHFFVDSFAGNPGLCGNPLPNPCSPSSSPSH